MNTSQALKIARELMDQHGLQEIPVKLNRAKTSLGLCTFLTSRYTGFSKVKEISLSKHWTEALPEDTVRDTILHEIAHALAGRHANHGPAWRRECIRIGANPNRTADLPPEIYRSVKKDIAKYKAVCVACDKTYYFDRYTKGWQQGRKVCGKCRGKLKVSMN